MFELNEVMFYHDEAINAYGGLKGIRDVGGLDAALNRPWQTFASEELYPSCFEKAAAIAESIILNHPFLDGNKRTGLLLCEAILETDGWTIQASTNLIYDFIVNISAGQLTFEEIVTWLRNNSNRIE
jgi:death-on-curing protein